MTSYLKCSKEVFVRAWMEAWAAHTGSAGVAKATGLSREGVFTKAARLRKQGVTLPKMRWIGERDPRKLNNIIHAFLARGSNQ